MINLIKFSNLKANTFEYLIRIILRKTKHNNFIFQTIRFTNFKELVIKYKLNLRNYQDIFDFLNNNWTRFDLIEFGFDNTKNRLVQTINIYDVKTKNHYIERDYVEMCFSSYDFYQELFNKYNILAKIIKVTLYENWNFSYFIENFADSDVRVYSRYKNIGHVGFILNSEVFKDPKFLSRQDYKQIRGMS